MLGIDLYAWMNTWVQNKQDHKNSKSARSASAGANSPYGFAILGVNTNNNLQIRINILKWKEKNNFSETSLKSVSANLKTYGKLLNHSD